MKTARLRKGHGLIQRDIMTMKDVHALSKSVYCLLVAYTGDKTTCYPSIITIADNLGLSKPTVIKAIKELESKELVIVSKVQSKLGFKSNVYEPLFLLEETSVNEIDLGGKGDLPSSVNDVDYKNNIIKNNIEEGLNSIADEESAEEIMPLKSKEESAHHRIIQHFFEVLHPTFIFSPMHAKTVKEIIGKTKTLLSRAKDRNVTEESIGDFVIKVLDHLPGFYQEKDLTTINSKYNEIILELKNKIDGKKSNTTKPVSKYAPSR